MAIEMSSDPNVLTFSAAGQEIGELRVDVDARDGRGLTEFACGVNGRWLYRHAFAKAATALPGALLETDARPRGAATASTRRR